ncbi:leucine-rich repeat domain-containing protein [Lacrimispora sp. NSJ-141]|uniref:Leucine-rich repeat domain-containing protein n=1 Tax=Lientehia hominis TaxID=2897778 RepID=A0AAP2RJH6_9FIRM|nr:leucine-rich repeat domain-containing protein [Lientehia hominis]MCD2493117.1 leucine-rich repeat domain-containing protein [Lientehia hominis]
MKRGIAAGCAALMCMVMVLSLLGGLGPVQAEVPEESVQTEGNADRENGVLESQKDADRTEETTVSQGESSQESHETNPADTAEAGTSAARAVTGRTDIESEDTTASSEAAAEGESSSDVAESQKGLQQTENNIRVFSSQLDYSQMYTFSQGTITGFSDSYLNSLPEENGNRYTDIVIPAEINGQKVTKIGGSAFLGSTKRCEGIRVKRIDLSGAVNLVTIDSMAFYALGSMYSEMGSCSLVLNKGLATIGGNAFNGQKTLNGSLYIPDSVTSIGSSAFSGCGFDGTLHLPENASFTEIQGQVFQRCCFTGSLEIPDNVTSIIGNYAFSENDFTEIVLNSGITKIGGSSFMDCGQLTKVRVAGKTDSAAAVELPDVLSVLDSNVFRNCKKLSGWVKIPDGILNVGSSVFTGTGIRTIYMPDSDTVAYTTNFLFDTTLNAAVFPTKALYDQYQPKMNSGSRQYCAYPLTVTFLDEAEQVLTTRETLYQRPLNYHETANGWEEDSDFHFPETAESMVGYDIGWSFTKGGKVAAANALVAGGTLYFSKSVSAPQITFEEVKTKEYDGKTEYIRCLASHPLAGEDGEYTFLYCTLKGNDSSFFYASDEPFVYPVTDVGDSMRYVCYVQMYEKAHPEYRGKWSMSTWYDYFATWVDIRQASPVYHPQFPDHVPAGTTVSQIPLELTIGDTPGTVSWDVPDAVINGGEQTLAWTYIPEDTENYISAGLTGEAKITGDVEYPIHIEREGKGTVDPDTDSCPVAGQIFTFTPEYGYKLQSVMVDGMEMVQRVQQLDTGRVSYTLDLIPAGQTEMKVVFGPVKTEDLEDMAEALPKAVEDEQDIRDVLNMKMHYEALEEQEKNSVSEDTVKKLAGALQQIPSVEVRTNLPEAQGEILSKDQEAYLLSCMTAEEAGQLLDGTIGRFVVAMHVLPKDETEMDVAASVAQVLGDYQIGTHYEISIEKQIFENASAGVPDRTETISELSIPLRLVLTVPEELMPSEGTVRKFALIRTHDFGGKIVSQVLEDLDLEASTITVDSGYFSTYSVVYADSKKEEESTEAEETTEPEESKEEGSGSSESKEAGNPTKSAGPSKPGSSVGKNGKGAAGTAGQNVKTGDQAPVLPAISGILAAILVAALLISYKKKISHQEES